MLFTLQYLLEELTAICTYTSTKLEQMPVHIYILSDLIQMQVNGATQADLIEANALMHPHAYHTWLLQQKLDTLAIVLYSTIFPRRDLQLYAL